MVSYKWRVCRNNGNCLLLQDDADGGNKNGDHTNDNNDDEDSNVVKFMPVVVAEINILLYDY